MPFFSFWQTGTLGILNAITTRETYAPVLLERKARRLRKLTGNPALYAKGQRQMPVSALLRRAIVRPLKMLCFCPLVTGLSFYIAIVYGFTYLLFSTFSFVFEGQYHYTPSNLGLAYLGLAGGMLISLTIASVVSDRSYVRLTKKHNKEKPEYMLIMPTTLANANLDKQISTRKPNIWLHLHPYRVLHLWMDRRKGGSQRHTNYCNCIRRVWGHVHFCMPLGRYGDSSSVLILASSRFLSKSI